MPISRWQESEQIQGIGIVQPHAINAAVQGLGQLGQAAQGAFNQALQVRQQEQEEDKRRRLEIFQENIRGTDQRLRDTYSGDSHKYDRQAGLHFDELVGTVDEDIREDAAHLARRVRIGGSYDMALHGTQQDRQMAYSRLWSDIEVEADAIMDGAQSPAAAREGVHALIDRYQDQIHPDDMPGFVEGLQTMGTRAGAAIDEMQDSHQRNMRVADLQLQFENDTMNLREDLFRSMEEAPLTVPVFGPGGDQFAMATAGGNVVGEQVSGLLSNGRARIGPEEFQNQYRTIQAEHLRRIEDFRVRNAVETAGNEQFRATVRQMREQQMQRMADQVQQNYEAFAANDRVAFAQPGNSAEHHYDARTRSIRYMELQGIWDGTRADQEVTRLNQRYAEGTTAGMLTNLTQNSLGQDTLEAISDTMQQVASGTLEVRVGDRGETAPISTIFDDRQLAQFRRNMDSTLMRATSGVIQSYQEAGQSLQGRIAALQGNLAFSGSEEGRQALDVFYSNTDGLNQTSGLELIGNDQALETHAGMALRTGRATPALRDLMNNYPNYGTEEDPDRGFESAANVFAMMDVEGAGRRALAEMLPPERFEVFDEISEATSRGVGLADALEQARERNLAGVPSAAERRAPGITEEVAAGHAQAGYEAYHRGQNRSAFNPLSNNPQHEGPVRSGTFLGLFNPNNSNHRAPRLSRGMQEAAASRFNHLREQNPTWSDQRTWRAVFRNMEMEMPEQEGHRPGITWGAGRAGPEVVNNSVEMNMTNGQTDHASMEQALGGLSYMILPYVHNYTKQDILVMGRHVNNHDDFEREVRDGNIRYEMMGNGGLRAEFQHTDGNWIEINPRDPETRQSVPIPLMTNEQYVTNDEVWTEGSHAWWNQNGEAFVTGALSGIAPGLGLPSHASGASRFIADVIDGPAVWMGQQWRQQMRNNFETLREGQEFYQETPGAELMPLTGGLDTMDASFAGGPLGSEAFGRLQAIWARHGSRMFAEDVQPFPELRASVERDMQRLNPSLTQSGDAYNRAVETELKNQIRPYMHSNVAPTLMDEAARSNLTGRSFARVENDEIALFRGYLDGGVRFSEDELLNYFSDGTAIDMHMVDEMIDAIMDYQEDLDR